jgi:dipeptide transport system ATP-binding protein
MKTNDLHDAVLIADDLTKHYSVGRHAASKTVLKALNGVSFVLRRGKTIAIVGESGCGKSTLARLLTLADLPTNGALTIEGERATGANRGVQKGLRQRIQMVFQNPYASLNPRKTVTQTLEEPLVINTNLKKAARSEQVMNMLSLVGLRSEHAGRYPHMFSGGQRQRIAIARAMMLNPSIVVADEPVSALDVSIQAQVLNLFMDLQGTFNTSYVFISHNLSVVEHMADDVVVMYFGSVVEAGPRDKVFKSPGHPYTRALLSATPSIFEKDRQNKIRLSGEMPSPLSPPQGCAFNQRCPSVQDRCRKEVPYLRRWQERDVACFRVEELSPAEAD